MPRPRRAPPQDLLLIQKPRRGARALDATHGVFPYYFRGPARTLAANEIGSIILILMIFGALPGKYDISLYDFLMISGTLAAPWQGMRCEI